MGPSAKVNVPVKVSPAGMRKNGSVPKRGFAIAVALKTSGYLQRDQVRINSKHLIVSNDCGVTGHGNNRTENGEEQQASLSRS